MKKKRDTEEQIGFVLRQAETGTPIGEVYRKTGISEQTFYRWKKRFAVLGDQSQAGLSSVQRGRLEHPSQDAAPPAFDPLPIGPSCNRASP